MNTLASRPRLFSMLRPLVPLVTTAFFYVLFSTFGGIVLGARNSFVGVQPFGFEFRSYWLNVHGGMMLDFGIQVALAYCLYAFSKRLSPFILLQGLLMALIYVGNAMKISMLGSPVQPTDIYTVSALLGVLGYEKWFLLVSVGLGIVLFIANLKTGYWRIGIAAVVGLTATASFAETSPRLVQRLNAMYGSRDWDHRFNHDARGSSIYLIGELAGWLTARNKAPTAEDVSNALALGDTARHATELPLQEGARNIYVIVVESLWDPSLLSRAGFDRDPFAADFRETWQQTGNSTILSPVFAGQTAEAEFELLCGQPTPRDGVVFMQGLKNQRQPCLPRYLRSLGYRTIAVHPNAETFWNRGDAYRRVGFDEFISLEDMHTEGMQGGYMPDERLFDEVLASVALGAKRQFVYVLTIAEHWPYESTRNLARVVNSSSKEKLVSAYANTVWYGTDAVMRYVQKVRVADPDAIIVVTGDHLPLLGGRAAGYVESGLLFDGDSGDPEVMTKKYSTPLVVIDGGAGAISLPTMAMYEFPAALLDLAELPVPPVLSYFVPDGDMVIRPMPSGMRLVLSDRGSSICKAEHEGDVCAEADDWLHRRLMISRDLRVGKQHALHEFRTESERISAAGVH